MKHRIALLLGLLAVVALVQPTSAAEESSGSYRIRVMPDPTVDASPYGGCGLADAWAVATHVGGSGRLFAVPAGKTLTVQLAPIAQVFVGDEGTVWRLQLEVNGGEVARSTGPNWKTEVRYRAARTERVLVRACNRSGHPDATVSFTVR